MATSDVEIANSALTKIGVKRIASFTEDSKAAELLSDVYSLIRDNLLQEHFWNFAQVRLELAATGDTPAFDFLYEYPLPADCLRVIRLHVKNAPFRIEERTLLCNLTDCKILYISNAKPVAYYSSQFVEALAYRLAAELAYPLIQSTTVAQLMHSKAEQMLSRARATDGQEGTMDMLTDDSWVESRFAGPGVLDREQI